MSRAIASASVSYTHLYTVGRPGAQVRLTQSAVMLGLRVRGRGGRDPTAPVAAPLSAFLWGSTPFLCARAKKWGGTGSRGYNTPTKETAHPCRVKDMAASSLGFLRVRRYVGWWTGRSSPDLSGMVRGVGWGRRGLRKIRLRFFSLLLPLCELSVYNIPMS